MFGLQGPSNPRIGVTEEEFKLLSDKYEDLSANDGAICTDLASGLFMGSDGDQHLEH